MDKSEIKEIVNTTLDERKKKMVSKIFHDPNRAEGVCLIAGSVCLLIGLVLGGFIGSNGFESNAPVFETFLENMECEGLKNLYSNPELTYSQSNQVEKNILIKCL